MATHTHSRASAGTAADAPTTADRPDEPIGRSADPDTDRGHVVQARHQWFGLAAFGGACCLAALIFSRWNPSQADGRWFWVVLGPIIGAVAMFRSQSVFGGEGADRDAGPYLGVLVGTTLGAIMVGWLGLAGWVLPGVFFVVAAFLAFMAWLEQSAIGMTTALTMIVLAACTAVVDIPGAAALLSFCLGLMFLSGAVALALGGGRTTAG